MSPILCDDGNGNIVYCDSDPSNPIPAALGFAKTAGSAEANEPDTLQPSNESADADAIFASLEHTLATDTKEVMEKLLGIPIEKGFEMDRRLKADSNLLVEFNEKPSKVLLEEVGLGNLWATSHRRAPKAAICSK